MNNLREGSKLPSLLTSFLAYQKTGNYSIFGALAEFERDIIRERTQAGLQAARARGRKGGRPKSLTGKKVVMVQALYNDKNNTVDEICKTLNISRTTLYRYIKT